jgi:hypothetical protein
MTNVLSEKVSRENVESRSPLDSIENNWRKSAKQPRRARGGDDLERVVVFRGEPLGASAHPVVPERDLPGLLRRYTGRCRHPTMVGARKTYTAPWTTRNRTKSTYR